jgi:hypothetical protein
LRLLSSVVFGIGLLLVSEAHGRSEAAKALVKEFKIRTYSATREDDDIYELLEGYVIRTSSCYVYAYGEPVVLTESKMIFIDSDEVCDIADVYKK